MPMRAIHFALLGMLTIALAMPSALAVAADGDVPELAYEGLGAKACLLIKDHTLNGGCNGAVRAGASVCNHTGQTNACAAIF
ncbi:MAG TPA: hypothetical protein VGR28_11995 [Candidatus Thermoplasmatota archaeon]|nr:hypothetical protein [Candidatus Thermoplasmatota archaeon]